MPELGKSIGSTVVDIDVGDGEWRRRRESSS